LPQLRMRLLSARAGIKSLTLITPNQDMASGGPYVIQTLARELAKVFEVNLVALHAAPREVEGVHVFQSPCLRPMEIPDADAIVLYADATVAEHFACLPASKGKRFVLFQGYGIPKNPVVISNLRRNFPVVAVAHWLVEDAANCGCLAAYMPCGVDRTVFYCGELDRDPRLVAMMTHTLDWKGTADGAVALAYATSARPETRVVLFGKHNPGLPGARFVGSLPTRKEVAELMRRVAVFVCPSWEEGFGMPGLEAMFCGAALATTDTKGSRDYAFDGETALVSRPKDPESLGRNIVRLLEDQRLRDTIARRALRFATRYYPPWDEAGFLFAKALVSLASRG